MSLISAIVIIIVVVRENVEVVFDNEPSDRDCDAGDPENYGPASVSVLLRFCRCPVASKPSSTEYEDEGHFDPKPRGRHRLNKNVGVFGHSAVNSSSQSMSFAS
ncbi:MAG: hypothetical protein WCC43_11710, partial [Pseudolabrys sp.]